MNTFPDNIDLNVWGGIMLDVDRFRPIIDEICELNDIKCRTLEAGYPGTHAVFSVNDAYYIKIYAPLGFPDESVERAVYRATRDNGADLLPAFISEGALQYQQYMWPYIVMKKAPGVAVREIWRGVPAEGRVWIGRELGTWMKGYHALPDPLDAGHVCGAANWRRFLNDNLRRNAEKLECAGWGGQAIYGMTDSAAGLDDSGLCLVHGDLTEDHLYIDEGRIAIIDMADSRMAPPDYEWPPIWFGAFERDVGAIVACAEACGRGTDGLARSLAGSTMAHYFGADIVVSCWAGPPPKSFDEVASKLFDLN